jgi:agmatinase
MFRYRPGEEPRVNLDTRVALSAKANPRIADVGDFNIFPTDLMKTTDSVTRGVAEITKRGGFPLVLGGDHYVAYPSFEGFARGMAERKPGVRLGYIHIDSHTDFLNDYGGLYSHGTCVRRVSENSAIALKNIAWLGINPPTVDADQYRLWRDHHLKMVTAKDIRERGIEECMRDVMNTAADGVDAVYVSVDIDVVDGSESPGTGWPEFEGILARDFLQVMDMLSHFDKLKALDLCEVAPEWDPSGRTLKLAARGLLNVLRPWIVDAVELPD